VPEFTRRSGGSSTTPKTTGAAEPLAPGKRTLTEQLVAPAPVQRALAHPAPGGATGAGSAAHEHHIAEPEAGIDKAMFVQPEPYGDDHTLVLDCPLFDERLNVSIEDVLLHGDYWFAELQ